MIVAIRLSLAEILRGVLRHSQKEHNFEYGKEIFLDETQGICVFIFCCQCGIALTLTQDFMVHTGREYTYKCSYCDERVIYLELLKEHMKFKQVSLSGDLLILARSMILRRKWKVSRMFWGSGTTIEEVQQFFLTMEQKRKSFWM